MDKLPEARFPEVRWEKEDGSLAPPRYRIWVYRRDSTTDFHRQLVWDSGVIDHPAIPAGTLEEGVNYEIENVSIGPDPSWADRDSFVYP